MPKYLKTKKGSLEQAVIEAVSPAQQAAIAISKKEKGEKPKNEKDENNYIHAAKMAKEKGDKTFTIGGKEYDVEEALKTETNKNDKSDDGEGLDAVQPKAVKKKFADRKDKDIDNDGDVDDSDKFLHKRRKAVSKSMKEDTVVDAVRAMWEAAAKKADPKTEEEDEDEKPSKDSKGSTTMTGKPMSKVEVAVKEKG